MKVVFLSNFLNHHQLPFSLNMQKRLGDGYIFVQTEPVNQERLDMGYEELGDEYGFVMRPYLSKQDKANTQKAVDNADFVIIGSAPNAYIANRLKENKPVIRYSERFLREKRWRFLLPNVLKYMYNNHTKYRNRNVYVLCTSAYTAHDFALFGAYKNKTYKWANMPEVIDYNIDDLIAKKRGKKLELLWVARFMKLKHPEKFLKCCKRLKADGIDFTAKIIGSGDQEAQMRAYVQANALAQDVHFLGTMSPTDVRKNMESANIFMFTSDYNEGWGAVLNEAMNSGCAVISSHAPGGAPFLIQHQKNGLIYKNGSFKDLYKNLRKVVDDSVLCEKLGKNAYLTLVDEWNANIATENLLMLLESLQQGKTPEIKHGLCSIAKPIPQRKMYRAVMRGEII